MYTDTLEMPFIDSPWIDTLPPLPPQVLASAPRSDYEEEMRREEELSRRIMSGECAEVYDVSRMSTETKKPLNVHMRIYMLASDFAMFRERLFGVLSNHTIVPQTVGMNVYFMYTVYPALENPHDALSYVFWFKKTADGRRVVFSGRRQGDGFACNDAIVKPMRDNGLMGAPFQEGVWKDPPTVKSSM